MEQDAGSPPEELPYINPDEAEQELGEQLDNIIPTYGYQQMPMVALGGSAGAIRALQSFFEALPDESGMVFIVILHLSPDHVSTMAEMIQRWTKMKAFQAKDGQKVEPNSIYVIPPGKTLTTTNGHLKLSDLDRKHGRRVTVDLFFRSLADTHGPHATAIVLSGADGDGTLGVKRIKERGGLTIAQDPDEAEHDSMPRAAIGTGMVDWVLPCSKMAQRIVSYHANESRITLPPEEGPEPTRAPAVAADSGEAALRDVLVFLRMRSGRDFTYYKRATILRRISRRMQVNDVNGLSDYLSFLRLHPGEAGALLKDLLVSVTNFFRDRDAFAALETQVIPELFKGKTLGEPIRIWVPGCATGEEAYSIAMLLLEHARTLDVPPVLQVFGCDLDDEVVQAARTGIYPDAITADVSEERLRRFFVKEHNGYRVRREVRETVLFATHDMLKDAPFSRLDLVSCRNLLIYLNRDAQARAFDIFHFALKPEGRLFLGSSDSVEDGSSVFTPLDKKYRIYQRRSAVRVNLPVPSGPSSAFLQQERQAGTMRQIFPASPVIVPPARFTQSSSLALRGSLPGFFREEERGSWSELHYKLIERFASPSILINADHDIQHLSESAGRFLQVSGGQPTTNLIRLVHPALRIELRAALFRALQTKEPAEVPDVSVELEGKAQLVSIRVAPAGDLAPDFLLVQFEAKEAGGSPTEAEIPASAREPIVQHLERELEHIKAHLRDTVEQYEASTEELRASNEELQAMNEELRSATEELETSREELQSINEELTTVNQELKGKVDELGHANSDLHNLMGAPSIATVFLDREMRIMRFTDSAAPIFNLIPGDIGRPLTDLQRQIDYPQIASDAALVLQTLMPSEREVNGTEGRCYLVRLLPYRTLEDRIGGVVLTFVDITQRQKDQKALREQLEELTRFNKAAVGRESRMIELKEEINQLLSRLGEAPRYALGEDSTSPEAASPGAGH